MVHGKRMGFGASGFQSPFLIYQGMILGKLFNCCLPQFPQLQTNDSAHLLRGLYYKNTAPGLPCSPAGRLAPTGSLFRNCTLDGWSEPFPRPDLACGVNVNDSSKEKRVSLSNTRPTPDTGMGPAGCQGLSVDGGSQLGQESGPGGCPQPHLPCLPRSNITLHGFPTWG